MNQVMNPVHDHDCSRCVNHGIFVSVAQGQTSVGIDSIYDLWVCPMDVGDLQDETLIARYGQHGDYISCSRHFADGYLDGHPIAFLRDKLNELDEQHQVYKNNAQI